MEKEKRISIRLSEQEKKRIRSRAGRCGLSTAEYLRQRALGYEPRAVPPGTLFVLVEKLDALRERTASPETEREISALLREISDSLLLPGKEETPWQPQASGR